MRKTPPGQPRPVTPTTILAAGLEQLADQCAQSPGFDAALLGEVIRLRELAGGLDPYLARYCTPESPELAAIAARTAGEDWNGPNGNGTVEQEMLSGNVEAQFLKMLVHLVRATRVLDVGMFTGYSALAMAEALPPDGVVVACEVEPRVAEFARQGLSASAAGRRVDVRVGPALATLSALADAGEQFELIFIDADKSGYRAYLDAILDGELVTQDGVIVVDNTLMQGQPWTSGVPSGNGAAIAAFNDAVVADPRVEHVIVPLRDGMTLIRRVDR